MAEDRRCIDCSHAGHMPYGCKGTAHFTNGRCGCDSDMTRTYIEKKTVAA